MALSGQAPGYGRQNLGRVGYNLSVQLTSTAAPGTYSPIRPSMCIEVRFVVRSELTAPQSHRQSHACLLSETLPKPKVTVFQSARGRSPCVECPLIRHTPRPSFAAHSTWGRHHRAFHHQYSAVTDSWRLIVDGGNFDWAAHAKRFPNLSEPDHSYHGTIWIDAVKPLGPIAFIIRARVVMLRDTGAAMSPFNAFQFIQGLETLPLRMREHCRNAAEVAFYLQRHPAVTRVIYAGLHENAEDRRRAGAYLNGGFGGLVGFELKGGREAGARFIDALKMVYHVANIGDVRSLAIHPAITPLQ